jgi:hypothetical protein
MVRQHDDNKAERNGRECAHKDEARDEKHNADLFYRKSREHFGSWEIKDTVEEDARRSRRQEDEDARLTNGKFRREPAKLDKSQQDRLEYRDEGYVGSLPREDRPRGESVEREVNGSHKPRKREPWEEDAEARDRSRTSKADRNKDDKDTVQPVDERDILLKEIENLATDGSQSPDRRIQAMIERLKLREESKLRSRREHGSTSPEKEAHGRVRNELRSPVGDHSLDRGGRRLKDEEDATRRDRSADRGPRSTERSNEDRNEPRRDDSFRKRSDTYNADVKSHRRKSREDEEDHSRSRADNSKRRSYAYDGSPEDFDVRIQKYDRALPETRRDLDRSSPRRISPKDSSLGRRESLKEHDREPVTKKSSFRVESKRATSKDRGDSALIRKTSLKDQDNDSYKRHIPMKSQHESSEGIRYFGKDQEELSRKDSMKDAKANAEVGRKGSYFKIPDDEFGRILLKDQRDDAERKISAKEHASGVSRIVLRNFDDESNRNNSFKNTSDSGRKNSFKEKNVEFGGISYKDRDGDSDKRKNSFKDKEEDFGRACYQDYENNIDRKTANDRYIEFGKISFKTQDDELRTVSPFKAEDHETVARASSFKERDVSSKRRSSLRNRGREVFDGKPDSHHARPLSPLNRDEPELPCREDDSIKDTKDFCSKAWHESNRTFSVKYLREHGKVRNAAEGRLEASPERGYSIPQDTRADAIEANNPEEDRFGSRGRIDPVDGGSPRFSSTRDRNGTTIIRICSSEDPAESAERRRRHRPAQEASAMVRRRRHEDENDYEDSEDEAEDHWRRTRRNGGLLSGRGGGDAGGATPSRTIWNYREGVWHFHESIAFDRSFMVQKREAIFINRWRR